MGTFSIWHWLIVLIIVVMIFGTKKLKNIGTDLGSAVKGFKEGMADATGEEQAAAGQAPGGQVADASTAAKDTIDVEAREKS